ncbi:MAG: sigma-70 family RNA polymerase sigma factor [Bacteroidetes bacterium]|jgi:RNA polymerase sigma-70 factor (ECF subfamily)|nr:sigma-70 family RNA polymerase sigma factor [Bacteroidota bacterium]
MTAILTRIFGFQHSKLVEDIVQDTFLSALKTWPLKGQPDNPSAWLMQVAKNKAINTIKKNNRLGSLDVDSISQVDQIARLFLDHEIKDSQLRMLFACCYPDLSQKNQIILMLKTLCGFSNAEISSALLMTPEAVKKALYRSKSEIHSKYNDITVPAIDIAKERLDTIYTVIYLMFSEGYKRSYDDHLISEDLSFEAVRLATLLLDIPNVNHGKTHALLSLIYFNIARFPARIGKNGEIIDLKVQDRRLWDKNCLNAGFHHLIQSRQSDLLSKFHLESFIASLHCSVDSYEKTDWGSILSTYQKLMKIDDSELIRLNAAIALGKVEGPKAGLAALDKIDFQSAKDKQYLLYAAKAELYMHMNLFDKAKSYYQVAADLAGSNADKKYLKSKIEECNRNNISLN